MDGVIRVYMDDLSTTDTEGDATSSPAGQQGSTASAVVFAADTSPADRRPLTTETDSNANIVDVVTDVQPAAIGGETVAAAELNGNVEEAPSDVEKQTTTSSSAQSSGVIERLDGCRSSDKRHVESKTLPRMTAAGRRSCTEKAGLSDSECFSMISQLSRSQSRVEVPSKVTVKDNLKSGLPGRLFPDSCSASLPVLSRLSLSSQTSSKPVDGQPAITIGVLPVNVVQSQPVTAKASCNVSLYTSTKPPSNSLLKTDDSSYADVRLKENMTSKGNRNVSCEQGNSSSACEVPVVSLSCSSLVDKLRSYVPSPGPLTQMYGGTDVVQVTSCSASQTLMPLDSSPMQNSLLTYSPLKVGGDVSVITAKISAARSCSRNAVTRPLNGNENLVCQRTGSLRSFRTSDSRSTPWLAAGERSMENLRSPSLVLGLPHSSSVSGGSVSDSCSVAISSGMNSSPSLTPLASRSSSLMSSDSSTLHTSTCVPDNSRKFFHHFCHFYMG